MKKFLIIFLMCCLFSLCSCISNDENIENNVEHQSLQTEHNQQIRALWLSCYELSPMFKNGTKDFFKTEIIKVFEKCKINNINTLFVQVRPFCDSFYPSSIFDWSAFSLSDSGEVPDFDPLQIIIDIAENYDISIHAWINPYRVSYDENYNNNQNISNFAFSCDSGVYLNPSNVLAQNFILSGVREILENYKVDGIHIDDYFYPQTKENFDEANYNAYLDNGGELSKNKWRCENVNSLVAALYSLVHSVNSDAVFSISPAGDIHKNKDSHYADVELWLSQKGYADWIVPQIYYGFENEFKPFENTANKWLKLAEKSEIKLICGLALYKEGKMDKAAGIGLNEWVEHNDIIERQIDYVDSVGFDGYSLFSYSSL